MKFSLVSPALPGEAHLIASEVSGLSGVAAGVGGERLHLGAWTLIPVAICAGLAISERVKAGRIYRDTKRIEWGAEHPGQPLPQRQKFHWF